jgi:hypothetical protein
MLELSLGRRCWSKIAVVGLLVSLCMVTGSVIQSKEASETSNAARKTFKNDISAPKTCTTSACIKYSNQVLQYMNRDVNPCDGTDHTMFLDVISICLSS